MNKNTALICEPRKIDFLPMIIKQFQNVLKDWNFVFYCGKDLKKYWSDILENIEIRELEVINFDGNQYNDFLKKKTIWESLVGEYILVFQADTWIHEDDKYNIQYFINLNKSYIGGNMDYEWFELKRESIISDLKNFNGGLSLRKRKDMINIIDNFVPKPCINSSQEHSTDAEDVYFTIGCYKLGLSVGDDEESSHFSVHDIYKDNWFGVHKPSKHIKEKLNNSCLENFLNTIKVEKSSGNDTYSKNHAIFDDEEDDYF